MFVAYLKDTKCEKWYIFDMRYSPSPSPHSLLCTSLFISWLCWKKIFEKSHKSHARVIFKDHFYCIFSARSRRRNLIQERGLNNVNLMQWKYPESINTCMYSEIKFIVAALNILVRLWKHVAHPRTTMFRSI